MTINASTKRVSDKVLDRSVIQRFIVFAVLSAGGRGLMLVQGVLIIRMMEKESYALYALATACVMALLPFSNSGLGMFLASFGGRHHSNPARLGSVLHAARSLQLLIGLIASGVITVVLPIQCFALNVPLVTTAAVTILGLLVFAVMLTGALNNEIFNITLHQGTKQILDLSLSVMRISVFAALWYSGCLNAITGLMTIVLTGCIIIVLQQRLLLRRKLIENAPPLADDLQSGRAIVRTQMPSSAWSSAQELLPWGLLAWLGTAAAVADLAALSRICLITGYIIDLLKGWFLPRISRCQEYAELTRMIFLVLAVFWLGTWLILATAYIFRDGLVWLLGKNFAHIRNDFAVMLGGQGIMAVAGGLFLVNSSRAWITHPNWFIVGNVVSQALGIWLLDLSTVRGIIILGVLPSFPFILVNVYFLVSGLQGTKKC